MVTTRTPLAVTAGTPITVTADPSLAAAGMTTTRTRNTDLCVPVVVIAAAARR